MSFDKIYPNRKDWRKPYYSRHKPMPKARQKDAGAVQQWRADCLPALKKNPCC